MLEFVRKGLLASLGAAVVTKEKIESVTRKWVDDGKISTEEAERLANELVGSGQRQWEELQTKILDTVRKALENLDLVTKTEIETLSRRIDTLEKRLAELEEKEPSSLGD
ncbi:MAG: phasin family protein [Deltaproteobacteria bacterium]|nr:phasin family protein [Deltaproteobacteria bacterium]MBW2018331.1 phasin family protein [Deltaproteobacteria bacterium]MBW2130880.1 phasin family protein [Deltaproteobacteria bacterium]MBW2305165.1 phasin family protein [Deltaproteobacteria bacterium]